ncbi:hypothetical protein G9A89_011195 [Geosiphon pyriformis]|nr:hypothetical protein G9A89_011195 [Geosiphon pyriformis]
MNLVNIHGMYTVNNPNNTWASNRVQKKLDYVFTDIVIASLVTNIGIININESFSTDHKAVITIIQSNRILADTKKSRSERKKCSTTMIDVKKAFEVQWEIYARETNRLTDKAQKKSETVLQAAECLLKRKVGAQSVYTKRECMDYKLVKIVADIIKQIRVNNANMHDNNIMQLLAK